MLGRRADHEESFLHKPEVQREDPYESGLDVTEYADTGHNGPPEGEMGSDHFPSSGEEYSLLYTDRRS